jgi:DeoR/GlpR family transcriptional regulator of sugar metabolism
MNLNQRLATNKEQKNIIAEKIASMVEDNDTIMLNSGTTTLMVFRALPQHFNLSIVTNSISIALEAASNPNFNIILLGGLINSKYQFTFGDDANRQLREYHADKLILSVDGIDIENGFSTYYNEEVDIDRQMLAQSSLCIIAADRSKFGRNAMVKISELSTADFIVTTYKPDEKENSIFYDNGITVINAK